MRTTSQVRGRRLARVGRTLVAALVVTGFLVGLPAAPAAAATPDLTLVTNATYTVDPDHARIAIGVDIVATNHLSDTVTRRYYFDRGYLAVMPGTSGFSLSASGASPTVSVAKRTNDYTLLLLSFGTKVYSGQSMTLHLAFDLKDPGGAPTRPIRVGQALVTFPIWSFATDSTPGSQVTLLIPADFTVQFTSGQLDGPSTDANGRQVFTSGRLADPLSFFAYVIADRPGAYAETAITTTVGDRPAALRLRAWSDDRAWSERVGALFQKGLPVLGTAIGLRYPRVEPLIVQEAVSRTLGGYAGLFDPSSGRIDVDYAAGPFVILHEASHIWFNGSLLADRWANEAFASHYAAVAAKAIGVDAHPDPLTPELEKSAIPLNAWGAIGESSQDVEAYAYAASVALADKIAERAGSDGLQRVWAAASDREAPYQPRRAGAPIERIDAAPDWRGLLDLLETSTGQRFDDLWRQYVVRPTETALLEQRAGARDEYAKVVAEAADWELPRAIRQAMTAWQFDVANGLLAQAAGVLDQRAAIATRASAVGLTPPKTLQQIFEGDRGLRAAAAEGDAELAAIATVGAAAATRPADPDLVQRLGLVGSEPDADLAAARAAFAAGDLQSAVDRSESARVAWTSARDVGTRRALSSLGVVLLVALFGAIAVSRVRGGRRARARRMAHEVARSGAYGTLPAEPPSDQADARIADGGGGEGRDTT